MHFNLNYYIYVHVLKFFLLFIFIGMADFQVLPPGVNSLDYKGIPVDQTTFQMTG